MADTISHSDEYDRMTRTGEVIVQPIPQNCTPDVLHHEDSIRIFNLQPSEDPSSDIFGGLEEKRLKDYENDVFDHFTALSYCWGSTSNLATINVNSRDYQVTRNVESALRNLRDKTRVLSLWIDSICINQHNVNERNHQVSQMVRIYSAATHTIIYLGESTEESTRSMEHLLRKQKVIVRPDNHSTREELFSRLVDGISTRQRDFEVGILSREWFRRSWVFQELVASQDPWVQCGRLKIRWKDIHQHLELRSVPYGLDDGLWTSLTEYERAREAYFSGERLDLRLLLLAAHRRQSKASDPRDQVFALLGVAKTSQESRSIRVDYAKSARDIYIKAAHVFLPQIAFLLILAIKTRSPGVISGLPSWVPNWSANMEKPQVGDTSTMWWDNEKSFNLRHGYIGWAALMPKQGGRRWNPHISEESPLLLAQACPIGRISKIGFNSADLLTKEALRSLAESRPGRYEFLEHDEIPGKAFFRCNNHFDRSLQPKSPYFGVCPHETLIGDILGFFPSSDSGSPNDPENETLFIFRPVDNLQKANVLVERDMSYRRNPKRVVAETDTIHVKCIGECHIIGPRELNNRRAPTAKPDTMKYMEGFWGPFLSNPKSCTFILH